MKKFIALLLLLITSPTWASYVPNNVKAEDSPSADGDNLTPVAAILKATPADTAGTDGDYQQLQMAGGRLWVDASGKTLTVSDTPTTGSTVKIAGSTGLVPNTIANGVYNSLSVYAATGSTTAVTQSVAGSLHMTADTGSTVALQASTAEIGNVKNTGTFATQDTPATGATMKMAASDGLVFSETSVGTGGHLLDVNLRAGTPTTITVTQGTGSNLLAQVSNNGTFATQDTPATGATMKFADNLGNVLTQSSGGLNVTPTTGSTVKLAGSSGLVPNTIANGVYNSLSVYAATGSTTAVTQSTAGSLHMTADTGSTVILGSNTGVDIGKLTANQSVNLNQLLGLAPATNSGSATAGTLQVVTATGSTVILGTNNNSIGTVQPGNTANTTPWLVTPTPGTTGGWSAATESTLSTVAQQVKGSAGTFGGYTFFNPNGTVAYLFVFDASSAAACTTTTLKLIMGIPATSAANYEMSNGLNAASGIYVASSNTGNTITANTIPIIGSVIYK